MKLWPKKTRRHRLTWAKFWLGWVIVVIVPNCAKTKDVLNSSVSKTKKIPGKIWAALVKVGSWASTTLADGARTVGRLRIIETVIEWWMLTEAEKRWRRSHQHWVFFDGSGNMNPVSLLTVMLLRKWVTVWLHCLQRARERRVVKEMDEAGTLSEYQNSVSGGGCRLWVNFKRLCFGEKERILVLLPVENATFETTQIKMSTPIRSNLVLK